MPAPSISALPLAKLQKQLSSKAISPAFINKMKNARIQTLQDIREKGGIPRKESLTAKEQEAARRLEAHAYLNLLSEDVEVNDKLINAGISSFGDIASTNKASFLERAKGLGIPEEQAAALHAKAEAAEAYLTHIITAARAEKASYSGTSIAAQALGDEFDQDCEVKECNSAVSPLAYLAELLVYATGDGGVPGHILFPGNFNTHEEKLAELEKRLYQPFGRFTNACEEVDRKVRQVRIATEVLRKKGHANPSKEADYCFDAYKALLTQIGTSYDELRRIKSADAKKRQALADRLGIPLRQSKPDELDMLLMEKSAVTEDKLEEMFGLQDTRRDPMLKGILSEDQYELIKDWRITNRSTQWSWGADGRFYGHYYGEYSNYKLYVQLEINLLNQKDELVRVALGQKDVRGKGPVWLQLEETNNSGISAEFLLNISSSNNFEGPFILSVQPTYLAWRLQYLRQQWQTQDSISDAYFKKELPVIDPDLIGPEDFRNPEDSNAVFRLWKKRRAWVDECLGEINKDDNKNDFQDKLNVLNEKIEYLKQDGTFVFYTPWPNKVDIKKDIIEGKQKLNIANERERQLQWIQRHKLGVENFSRLSELALKDQQGKEPLSFEEWSEIDSILVQVQKNTIQNDWIEDEADYDLWLSGLYFWKSLQEPEEGIWSPSLISRKTPVIDPETLNKEDIIPGVTGKRALELWQNRAQRLAEEEQHIAQCSSLKEMFDYALPTQPQPNDWKTELGEGAKYWLEKYHIGNDDFTFVEKIWQQEEALTDDQLNQLCAILVRAFKILALWSDWLKEEANLQYWQIYRARLPKWRASREQRALWQMALKNRGKVPILDPDLVQKNVPELIQNDSDLIENENIKSQKIKDLCDERKKQLETLIIILKSFQKGNSSITWGSEGNANGQFKRPTGVTIDKEGNVYVADQSNKRIQKFTPEGIWLNSWGQNLFHSPENILAHSNGTLYVTDRLGGKVFQFDLQGNLLNTILSPKPTIQNFSPYGIAETPFGNILISDSRNNHFWELDPMGRLVQDFAGEGGVPSQSSVLLSGIAIDKEGFIYVVDQGAHKVLRYAQSGAFIGSFGSLGTQPGQFKYPFGITIDPAGMLWVSDTQNNRLQRFNKEGAFLETINDVPRPYGICIDIEGGLWGTDQRNNSVYRKNRVQGLDELIKSQLGITVDALQQLEATLQSGTDITKRLDQIGLSYGAFMRLMGCWKLAVGDGQLEDSEWEEIYNILLQVLKTRGLYPRWKKEEQEAGIALSPDFFELPEKPEGKFIPVHWRSTSEDRWDWEDKLQNRIDQEKGIYAAMAEAVDKAEERTIAQLRDELVKVSGKDAKALSQELLMDMEISPCQKTTRISVAITTLQKLFFLLQTEQHLHNENFNDLSLENRNSTFEQHWKWLGSYETWRAAVGVFLYPENVLLPTLRREQSNGFSKLVSTLQTLGSVTPDKIKQIVKEEYLTELEDLVDVKEALSCVAKFCDNIGNAQKLLFKFILCSKRKNIYWSYFDETKSHDSFWCPIAELKDVPIKRIIGAHFYSNAFGNYVYIFFEHFSYEASEEVKFSFGRYDTIKSLWEIYDISELPEYSSIDIVIAQNHPIDLPPQILIFSYIKDNNITITFQRSFNYKGDDWENGDWIDFVGFINQSKGDEKNIKHSVISYEKGNNSLVFRLDESSVSNPIIGSHLDCYFLYKDKKPDYQLYNLGNYLGFFQSTYFFKNEINQENIFICKTSSKTIALTGDLISKQYERRYEGWDSFLRFIEEILERMSASLWSVPAPSSEENKFINDHKDSIFDHFDGQGSGGPHIPPLDDCYRILEVFIWFIKTDETIDGVTRKDWIDNIKIIITYIYNYFSKTHKCWDIVENYFCKAISGNTFEEILNKLTEDEVVIKTENTFSTNDIAIPTTAVSISDIYQPISVFGCANYFTEKPYPILIFKNNNSDISLLRSNFLCRVEENQSLSLSINSLEKKYSQFIQPINSKYIYDFIESEQIQNFKDYQESIYESLSKEDIGIAVEYCREIFYFLPMLISMRLAKGNFYNDSLKWLLKIYDFNKKQSIFTEFEELKDRVTKFDSNSAIIVDPLNVHELARTNGREVAYLLYTLEIIIQTLLQYADSEFSRDTPESIEKALLLYEKAKELLDSPELHPYPVECKEAEKAIADQARLLPPSTAKRLMAAAKKGNNRRLLQSVSALAAKYNKDKKEETLKEIEKLLDNNQNRPLSIAEMVQRNGIALESTRQKFLMNASIEQGLALTVKTTTYASSSRASSPYFLPKVATYGDFPVPWNPLIQMLYLHTENNLNKIRNCRNIAGIKREVEAYAAATDVESAMPSIGAGGQLVLPTSILPPPVPYRYEFVIDRAKQLVNIAVQMENAFISALEKKDTGLYEQLKARQELQLAQAGVKLQNLRLRQAKDEIGLAELQKKLAEVQFGYYDKWLQQHTQSQLFEEYYLAVFLLSAGVVASIMVTTSKVTNQAAQLFGGYIGQLAGDYFKESKSLERLREDWELQRDISLVSIDIGDQQIKIANDGVDITEQEVTISKLQVDQAKDIIEFLRDKDTSAELYDWMQGILKGIYSYFLQQATAMAKLAQNQLAFERQEPSPGFIQHDYWVAPSENAMGGASENATDRFGLTGSARLLADIYKLDQYHFDTEKRKLQLTKNISLASMAPFEFQRFRETGVITFQTLMQWFDRDFPGHYLRMIKRVRTSVVALVPPTEGIKATLSNIGVSRIITERNGLYQTIIAHRPPESVALTSPSNATGLFELESQSTSMMLPFEGLGVDSLWEFRMPKAANQFDYNTIADIILSVDYTALDSYDYRQLVIESLPRKLSGDRPYSFRYQFADAWYDLHNPDQSATPMTVTFRTRREDFPPNLERVTIQQVLLYFALDKAKLNDQEIARFDELLVNLIFLSDNDSSVGGETSPVEGIISTRRGNGSAWIAMLGEPVAETWTLSLPNTPEVRQLFAEEKIEDMLLVVTFAGQLPGWPE